MTYFKYFYWAYLLLAALFIYDGVEKLNQGESSPYPSFILAALVIFMFFFRRNYASKLTERYKYKK